MIHFKTRAKKIIAIFSLAILGVSAIAVNAQTEGSSGGGALEYIKQYTYDTAQYTYYIEKYTYGALLSLNSLLLPDTSTTTATLQNNFGTVAAANYNNTKAQLDTQTKLMQNFFIAPGMTTPASPQILPNANDLTYQTLLGHPFFEKDPRNAQNKPAVDSDFNYLLNASSLTVTHPIADSSWNDKGTGFKQRYINYYNTISAVQTFNGYVLSQLYAEYKNGAPLTTAQKALVKQATAAEWYKQVASENLGFVMRQTLMFLSQTYVLLTQQMQIQQQMLSSQAMTNSLLVLLNQANEDIMVKRATGNLP